MTSTPWAILLCKFSDDASEPYPRARFEELFTTAGNGKFNMVDFFRDMSHERVDLSGSRVFPSPAKGWYTLAQKRSDYTGFSTPTEGRNELIKWGSAAAAKNEDDLSGYFNVLVLTNVPTDRFGSPKGVASDDGRDPGNGMSGLSPSLLGQEMGHAYGLEHSRIEGSNVDYMDSWDVMSTAGSAFMAPHSSYTERDVRGQPIFLVGPGLNAANMWAMGWLDTTRTWAPRGNAFQSTVELRPLHRRDLPGYLCARVAGLFVEFRMNELWDAAIAEPVVLIHDYFDGHSYLRPGRSGAVGLREGGTLVQGDVSDAPLPVHGAGLKISVLGINADTRTATIQVNIWHDTRPAAGPGQVFGGVGSDGGGWLLVNGRVIRVPPRSPLLAILEQLADVRQSESMRHSQARTLVQREAYAAVANLANERLAALLSVREPMAAGLRALDAQLGKTPGTTPRPLGP